MCDKHVSFMDHSAVKVYFWHGKLHKYIQPLKDTAQSSEMCLLKKQQLSQNCKDLAKVFLKLQAERSRKKAKTLSSVVASSAFSFLVDALISDYEHYDLFFRYVCSMFKICPESLW